MCFKINWFYSQKHLNTSLFRAFMLKLELSGKFWGLNVGFIWETSFLSWDCDSKIVWYLFAFLVAAFIFHTGEGCVEIICVMFLLSQQLPKTSRHPDKWVNPVWKRLLRYAFGCHFPETNQDLTDFKSNTNAIRKVLCVLQAGTSSCFGLQH